MFREQPTETLVLITALSISMVMPVKSRRSTPEECSTGVLEQARRAFRADDLSQAERLAESIVDCPEALGAEAARLLTTVTSRRENDRIWQRAQQLIQRQRFEEACQLLHEIQVTAPDFPNLQVARQQADCNPDLVQLQEDLDRVDKLIEKENWQEAHQLLNRLLEKHPDETQAQERQRAVGLEIQRIHSKTAAFHYDAAVKLFEQGDTAGAKSRLQEVLKTSRDHPEARALLRKVETRLQEQANAQTATRFSIQARELQEPLLRLAVQSYYSGEYTETIAQLKGYLEANKQPPYAAMAYFFLGASVASVSMLSKNAPPQSLQTAKEHFRTGRHIDPDFTPPLESISPRIQAIFSQAVIGNR